MLHDFFYPGRFFLQKKIKKVLKFKTHSNIVISELQNLFVFLFFY